MMGSGRTAAVLSTMAVLSGVTTLLSRQALGAEPTTLECITAYEDSVPLRKNHQLKAGRAKLLICSSGVLPRGRSGGMPRPPIGDRHVDADNRLRSEGCRRGDCLRGQGEDGRRASGRAITGIGAADRSRRSHVHLRGRGTPERREAPADLRGREAATRARGVRSDRGAETHSPLVKAEIAEQPPRPAAKRDLRKTTIAAIALGVGVAATGVGVAYGFIAMSRRDEASTICPSACPDMKGVNEWNDARSAGNIATGAFIVGAVGIASGVVVWLLARPTVRRRARCTDQPGARWNPACRSLVTS